MASYLCFLTCVLGLMQVSSAQFYIKCTFESDNCPSLLQSTSDDHEFSYISGGTPSANTGPLSGAGGSGKYAFLEASGKRYDSSARLTTGPVGFEGPACLKFQYSMYGSTINKLSVLLTEDGQNDVSLWSKSGNQGTSWKTSQRDFTLTSMNQMVVFEALVGTTFLSDIALDNVEIFSGSCASGPNQASTLAPSGSTGSNGGTGTPGTSTYPRIWGCDFDSDFNDTCKVVQTPNSLNWNWLRLMGSTPSGGTGPPSAYDGSYYFYVEGSGTSLLPGSQTTFTSPMLKLSGELLCVKVDFYYYMYGTSMGNLEVRAVGDDFDTLVTIIEGDQGEQWLKASEEVDVPTDTVTLQFTAIRGAGYRSDIAVDRIKVYDCSAGGVQVRTSKSPSTGGTSIVPTEKPITVKLGSSTTTAPNAGASNVELNPTYVSMEDDVPGSVVCKVVNTASLPFSWNGFKWYNPSGNLIASNYAWAIIDTVYHVPSASSSDFWTSTLYIDPLDYTLNGKYVCEVNYDSDVTRLGAMVDVKGCPSDNYTCKNGGGCIPCNLLCDGLNDCGDMSDELGCNTGASPLFSSCT